MKRLLVSLVTLSALFLGGCATNHDEAKKKKDIFVSSTPAPVNFTETAKKQILGSVRDPAYNATLINHFSGPKVGSFTPLFGEQYYGYVTCYNVDTKNFLGMFTGNRLYMYIFHGENIMLEAKQSGFDPITDKNIAETCKKAL